MSHKKINMLQSLQSSSQRMVLYFCILLLMYFAIIAICLTMYGFVFLHSILHVLCMNCHLLQNAWFCAFACYVACTSQWMLPFPPFRVMSKKYFAGTCSMKCEFSTCKKLLHFVMRMYFPHFPIIASLSCNVSKCHLKTCGLVLSHVHFHVLCNNCSPFV